MKDINRREKTTHEVDNSYEFDEYHEGVEFQVRWFEDRRKWGERGGVHGEGVETLREAKEILAKVKEEPMEFPKSTYKIVRVTVEVFDG